MSRFKRVFLIVCDSMGMGAMADSEKFGDVNVDTLGHISDTVEHFNIPNLRKLGLANLKPLSKAEPVEKPLGYYCPLNEMSNGKDTMTGHWEMMGIHTTKPFVTFTDTGFPKELLDELSKRCGKEIIGNKSASGTEILEELAETEINEGKMIVYTSADSVLQICGNEETFDLQNLYRCCEIARELCMRDEWKVGRVIARPYVGKKKGEFKRTANRHDYAVKPTSDTALNALKNAGFDVISIGKINDIFVTEGITKAYHSNSSVHGMEQTIEEAGKDFTGLCFVNLVDCDMIYGHRRDIDGYANAISEFDRFLSTFIPKMKEEDILMISADHGCDPGFRGTDHTREYVPFLAYGKSVKQGANLGIRESFADVAKTILDIYDLENTVNGVSFKKELLV